MPTSTLYDLIVAANFAAMAAMSAIVVLSLRRLLRRWASIWLKTIAIHAINVFVILILLPRILSLWPTLQFAGLVIGTAIDFCFFLMLADGVRVWAKATPSLVRACNGLGPTAIFLAIFSVGLLVAQMSLRSVEGKSALERARWNATVYQSFARQPYLQEVFNAMRQDFPAELQAIMNPYVALVEAEYARTHQIPLLPKFPLVKITQFLASRRDDLVHAPDAELGQVAMAMPAVADFLTKNHASCTVEASGVVSIHVPDLNRLASPETTKAAARLIAAMIFTARAGADHPVNRDLSPARASEFRMLFRRSLSPRLQEPFDDLVAGDSGPRSCNMEVLTTLYRSIGTLPPAEAADYLALAYSGRFREFSKMVAVP